MGSLLVAFISLPVSLLKAWTSISAKRLPYLFLSSSMHIFLSMNNETRDILMSKKCTRFLSIRRLNEWNFTSENRFLILQHTRIISGIILHTLPFVVRKVRHISSMPVCFSRLSQRTIFFNLSLLLNIFASCLA